MAVIICSPPTFCSLNCGVWIYKFDEVVILESIVSWNISNSELVPNIILLESVNVISSPALTAISVPLVVLPKPKTCVNDSPGLLSTYNLTAALVGIVVSLSKFSIPFAAVTNCVIVTPVPVSFKEPHSSIAVTLKSPAVFK